MKLHDAPLRSIDHDVRDRRDRHAGHRAGARRRTPRPARQVLQRRRQADDVQPRVAPGYAVAIDGNDRIVVAGYTLTGQTDLAVARFLPNGTPGHELRSGTGASSPTSVAPTTGSTSRSIPTAASWWRASAIPRAGSKAAVVRYLPRGKRNKDFGGGDGIVLTSFGKKYQGANAVVIGASGNITIGGFTSNGSTAKWALARYGPRGVLDKSFGGDGKVTVDLSPADERINDMVIADGGTHRGGRVRRGRGSPLGSRSRGSWSATDRSTRRFGHEEGRTPRRRVEGFRHRVRYRPRYRRVAGRRVGYAGTASATTGASSPSAPNGRLERPLRRGRHPDPAPGSAVRIRLRRRRPAQRQDRGGGSRIAQERRRRLRRVPI